MLSWVTIAGEQWVKVSSLTPGRSRTKLTHSRTPHELIRRTSARWNTTLPLRRRRSSAKSAFSSISPKNSTVVKPGRSLIRHDRATDSACCGVAIVPAPSHPPGLLPRRRLLEVLLDLGVRRVGQRGRLDQRVLGVDPDRAGRGEHTALDPPAHPVVERVVQGL